jgi:hypothetical protein
VEDVDCGLGSSLTPATSDNKLVSSISGSKDPESDGFIWLDTTDNPRAFLSFTNLSFDEAEMSEDDDAVFRPRKDDSVSELAEGLRWLRTIGNACLGGSVSARGKLLVRLIRDILRLVWRAMSDGMSALTRGPN